jgi:uncharacterized protein YecE (DUF72 family)
LKKDVPRLRDFLALLPSQPRAAFEFRHQSWFDEEVFGLLRDHRSALCIGMYFVFSTTIFRPFLSLLLEI